MTDRVYSTDPASDRYVEAALDMQLGELQQLMNRMRQAMADTRGDAALAEVDERVKDNATGALAVIEEGSTYALDQLLSYIMTAIVSASEALCLMDSLETTFQASKIVNEARKGDDDEPR